jgi:ketosteroid isomerase-like protein
LVFVGAEVGEKYMNHVRSAFLLLVIAMSWGVNARASDAESSTVLVDMFRWWNEIINTEEPLTAEQFRRYFTEDAVILVNNLEQVRGVEHMPAHFQAIRERPGSIEVELPFREEFQSGDRIFTYHAIRSTQDGVVNTTYNMGYAILEGDRIASVSLARFTAQ